MVPRRVAIYDAGVNSEPATVVPEDEIADAARRDAARIGRSEAEVVEIAVRRLMAPSIIDRLQERATLSEDEAMAIAVEEVRALRAELRVGWRNGVAVVLDADIYVSAIISNHGPTAALLTQRVTAVGRGGLPASTRGSARCVLGLPGTSTRWLVIVVRPG